jgi:hypothetical protein
MPSEEEVARWQRVRAIMNEILQGKGLVEVVEEKVYVVRLKGRLEEGWQLGASLRGPTLHDRRGSRRYRG